MSVQQLPIDSNPEHSTQTFTLDGANYTFELRWNDRSGAWFLDILDTDELPIVCGVRVVVDFPLGARCTDPRKLPGALIAVDTSNKHTDPGRDDLGTRVQLLYYEAADLPVS